MNIRSFRIVPVTVSVIMALATGCGTVSSSTPAAGQPDPGETDVTVAAIPATDLAGLYIAQDQGAVRPAGAAREDRADTQQPGDHR
jgi:ABC-type nitrate/sulfonate/bicarbonate transport system substrate-binding protein